MPYTTSDKILVIVQARYESSRLPGKVVKPLYHGTPMIIHQLNRMRGLFRRDQIVVATANTENSLRHLNPLIASWGIKAWTPHIAPDNVLGRYVDVINRYHVAYGSLPYAVVRVTADCPLWCPDVGYRALDAYRNSGALYVALDKTWGDGLDVEVMDPELLFEANRWAKSQSDKEHVTPYIWREIERGYQELVPCPGDLSQEKWSVDTEKDLKFVDFIYRRLYPQNCLFTWQDVYKLLQDPAVLHELHATSGERHPANTGYTEQIAREQGLEKPPDWKEVRYGNQ